VIQIVPRNEKVAEYRRARSKFPWPLVLILGASCVGDDDPRRVEKWYLESWEGTFYCILAGPDEGEEKNKIVENLLGLKDIPMTETELHLDSDGKMQILKNGGVVLSGKWNDSDPHILTLTANDQFWNFEIINQSRDSIVLRTKNYQFIQEVEIVLKARQFGTSRIGIFQ
jgi:hypothetical protein